ncbi:hypothetical protein EGT74_08025 [Chitinophaga lutea]|uniref:Uncharacterized protein n=1 Tax=Chitinophaga lutea TaxID=2488634 RepID=A0A3N4Q1J6_9BACT|nr:hypothetical protein EGT74_08025 [Chitinophaga lutea]
MQNIVAFFLKNSSRSLNRKIVITDAWAWDTWLLLCALSHMKKIRNAKLNKEPLLLLKPL